jgi:glycosyltransferase involved in cell wall biosynthesis
MAMKIPCVTSPLANAPLGALEGNEILVGHNKEELANLIISLLNDDKLCKTIGEQGRIFVENKYSWNTHNKKLAEIII